MPEEDGVSPENWPPGDPRARRLPGLAPAALSRQSPLLPRDFSPTLMGALAAGVNNFFLVSLFFFFKGTIVASLKYRKTSGELGREGLNFQLGVMGEIWPHHSVCVCCFCC